MKFRKPKLVCYDWDNTLVDTQPVTLVSMNMLYKQYGKPELTVPDIVRINGYYFADVFTATFGKEMTKQIQAEYQLLYDNYAKDMLQPIQGALDTVKKIHEAGIKQIVISNKPSNIVRREAEKFYFSKYFDLIVGPTDCNSTKPHIEVFNYVKTQIEFKEKWHHPDKLWFFGDAGVDMEFAKQINARLFFLGSSSIVENFPTNHLVLLKSHHQLQSLEFDV